jgi:hypothetical protein
LKSLPQLEIVAALVAHLGIDNFDEVAFQASKKPIRQASVVPLGGDIDGPTGTARRRVNSFQPLGGQPSTNHFVRS